MRPPRLPHPSLRRPPTGSAVGLGGAPRPCRLCLGGISAALDGLVGLAALLPLLYERRDPVRQVPRQRLEQARHLLHRRGQGAGQTCQQHVPGRQVGQRRQVRGRQQRPVGQSALDDEMRVGPREVPQRLGHRTDVALHEGQCVGAGQVFGQRLVVAAVDGPADQGVLEDLVVAPDATPARSAELGQLGDGQAAVLAHDGGRRLAQARLDLVDHLDLVRPCCVLRCHRASTGINCPGSGQDLRRATAQTGGAG